MNFELRILKTYAKQDEKLQFRNSEEEDWQDVPTVIVEETIPRHSGRHAFSQP